MINIDPNKYVEYVRRKFLGTRDLLNALERELPKHGPKKFLLAVNLYVEAYSIYFEDRLKRSSSNEERKQFCQEAISWVVDMHEKFLPYLLQCKDAEVPFELFPAFVHIVKNLFEIKSDFEFALFPALETNYGFYGFQEVLKYKDISTLLNFLHDDEKNKILEKAKDLPRWIVFYSYPYIERSNETEETCCFTDVQL